MIKKLKQKFVFFFMLIITIMLIAIFGLVIYFTGNSFEKESIRTMQNIGRGPHSFKTPAPNEPTSGMRFPYFSLLLNEDGTLASVEGGYYDLSDKEFLQKLADTVLASSKETGVLKEYNLRYCRLRLPAAGQEARLGNTDLGESGDFGENSDSEGSGDSGESSGIGESGDSGESAGTEQGSATGQASAERIIFADVSSEISALHSLIRTCILIGILCFFFFLALSLLLSKWAVRPLEQAWEQQRQFVSDASHELKTPLTVILTNAEMLQDPAHNEEEKNSFSANILTMAAQMRGLVENLLELARVDNGAVKRSFQPLDFSQLISEVLLPFEPLYYEKGLKLISSLEASICLNGNPEYLTQVISILLDNAQKYAAPASVVEVHLMRTGKSCLFSVKNAGEEIPPADQKNIYKRFYRMDKARTMNHSYGLGLAIAQNIVAKHKGKIWCTSQEQINTFFVSLPL
ncbi:MAG: HAMP domain-containing sensor histidine kinase [Lachnospiraceae bacterium]|nr:HAMP domain-containing sensor histidine kinase [Lachnospiraceae bacterium]